VELLFKINCLGVSSNFYYDWIFNILLDLSELGSRAALYEELMGGVPSQSEGLLDEYEDEEGEMHLLAPPPSKTMQASPSRTMEMSPSKTMQQSPSKTMQQSNSKMMQPSPSKAMIPSPSKTVQQSPSKTVQMSQSKTMQQGPSKTVHMSTSKTMEQTPSKTATMSRKTMYDSPHKLMENIRKTKQMSRKTMQMSRKTMQMSPSKTQLSNEAQKYHKKTRLSDMTPASLTDMQQQYGLTPTQNFIAEWEPFRSHLVDMVFHDEGVLERITINFKT